MGVVRLGPLKKNPVFPPVHDSDHPISQPCGFELLIVRPLDQLCDPSRLFSQILAGRDRDCPCARERVLTVRSFWHIDCQRGLSHGEPADATTIWHALIRRIVTRPPRGMLSSNCILAPVYIIPLQMGPYLITKGP